MNTELPKFERSGPFKSMVERISKEFHFADKDFETRSELVVNMYDMCRYEEAWYSKKSVWCMVKENCFNT